MADKLEQVKPEAPPPLDMRDPDTFKEQFELNNRHLGLYFSQSVMSQLYELLEDIVMRVPADLANSQIIEEWNGSMDYIEALLEKVANPYSK